jgi:hypothetical protein
MKVKELIEKLKKMESHNEESYLEFDIKLHVQEDGEERDLLDVVSVYGKVLLCDY